MSYIHTREVIIEGCSGLEVCFVMERREQVLGDLPGDECPFSRIGVNGRNSLLPDGHGLGERVELEGALGLGEVHVLDLGLGVVFEEGLDSFEAGFVLEPHVGVYFLGNVPRPELVLRHRGVRQEVQVLVLLLGFLKIGMQCAQH